jgi:hypothetical protein
MRFTRFEYSVLNQQIEMATDSSRGQTKAFADGYGGRWTIFED